MSENPIENLGHFDAFGIFSIKISALFQEETTLTAEFVALSSRVII